MSFPQNSSNMTDPVRPGEQWFFYWKTSAALWEHKIQEFPPHEIVFIPLYWGLHAGANGSWDFGKNLPELDLGRLIKLLTQHGRRSCWLLPLSPAPFLPNGGVPISSARTLSTSPHGGMHFGCLDQEGILHKMYSFFEPKVMQSFAGFVQEFGQFLSTANYKAPIWGVDFYYLQDHKRHSFLDDSSLTFEQGFSRYLKKNHPEGTDLTQTKVEEKLKQAYRDDVASLIHNLAADALAPFWAGTKEIVMFGASPKDTIERTLSAGKTQLNYFEDLFQSYVNHQWFSTALLNHKEKKDLLHRCLAEHFSNEEIQHRFHYLTEPSELGDDFRPYVLIDLIEKNHTFKDNGLVSFLNEHFRWMYYINSDLSFTQAWIESGHHRVKFFEGQGMDRTQFGQMLKLFMMGQRVVFDRSGLSEELEKRLEVFFLENSLKQQSVNFITPVSFCELGEGRFITIEGKKLTNPTDQQKFWSHLFKFLNMNHPKLSADKDVFSLWRIRATSPHELNYLDVRRVNIYNPTSYKKSVMVQTQKKFAFMKVIDPLNATAKTTTEGVEIELLPNGKLALDFGHYEER